MIAVSIQLRKFLISSIRKPSFHLLLENHWSVCVLIMLAVQNCLTYYPGSLPLVSSPDPTHERRVSGDTWLIPQASLKIHSLLCAWLTTKNKSTPKKCCIVVLNLPRISRVVLQIVFSAIRSAERISLQKVIETQGLAKHHQTLGGVWAWDNSTYKYWVERIYHSWRGFIILWANKQNADDYFWHFAW